MIRPLLGHISGSVVAMWVLAGCSVLQHGVANGAIPQGSSKALPSKAQPSALTVSFF